MKCYCKETEKGFYYVVEDAPVNSYNLIEKAFFKKDGSSFLKWYPVDMPDKDIIIPNYERLAPAIFLRDTVHWEDALDKFCNIAKKNSIDFVIRGSVVACIYGANITPTDIDVNIDVSDVEKIKSAFTEYLIEPFVFNDSLMMVRYFGRLCFNNVWVDISSFPKKGYEVKNIELTFWNGHIVKVQSLESCLQVYKQIGRLEYVKAIENFLLKNGITPHL